MPFEIKEDGEVVKCEMTNQMIVSSETPATKAPEKGSLPQTGDTTNIDLALCGLGLSAMAIGVLYFRRKKAKAE